MMVLMSNEKHGLMHCYSPTEVESNKKNGWVVVDEIKPEQEKVDEAVISGHCKKCGKIFERGLTMHSKFCKG